MHAFLVLLISLVALIWAANHLVTGASALAMRFNLSPLVIGLTLVASGTSGPELIRVLSAALKNNTALNIGNAIGSNIANISLVLGITILIKPLALNYAALKKTYPVLIIIMLFAYSMMLNGFLSRIDGCLLLIACIAAISSFIHQGKNTMAGDPVINQFKRVTSTKRTVQTNLISLAFGLIVLPVSSRYSVISAIECAKGLGMSQLTTELTISALGASLPELITAITAACTDKEEIAVGTILGANIYNILLILFFPAIINPTKVSSLVLQRDMPIMIALTLLLFFLNFYYKNKLSRWHGRLLLLIYCSYIISLFVTASAFNTVH